MQLGIFDRKLTYLYANRTFNVTNVIVHVDYDFENVASPHDLALLKLDRPAEMIRGLIVPICLPISDNFPDEPSDHVTVNVAGWGSETDPQCTTGLGGPAPFHPCKVTQPTSVRETRVMLLQFPFVFDNVTYFDCTKTPNPAARLPMCAEFFNQRSEVKRLKRVQDKHVKDQYPATRLSFKNGTEIVCWEAPRVGPDSAKNHSQYLSGTHGWCGVCHSDVPGTPGYCNKLDQHTRSHEVSFLQFHKFFVFDILILVSDKGGQG